MFWHTQLCDYLVSGRLQRVSFVEFLGKITKADLRLNEFDDLWYKVQQTKG